METASVADARDYLFGEPMTNPGEAKIDPQSLSCEQWLRTKWRDIHKNRRPIVRQTDTGTVQNLDRVDQTTPENEKFMQPMMFKEDFRPAHIAYLKGQQMSRDKERINKHVIPAAFKAAMSSSHMELFYRELYNNGAQWGVKIAKQRWWCEDIWSCYHMTLSGISDLPQKGTWLRPLLDGNAILALGQTDFTAPDG